jgi:hypothetical protein
MFKGLSGSELKVEENYCKFRGFFEERLQDGGSVFVVV